jgi:hypothetical protein
MNLNRLSSKDLEKVAERFEGSIQETNS